MDIIRQASRERAESLWNAAKYMVNEKQLAGRARNAVGSFLDFIEELDDETEEFSLGRLSDEVIKKSGLMAMYEAEKGEKAVGLLGLAVMVAVIALLLVELGEEALELFKQAGVSAIILNLAGIVLGMVGGRVIGLSRDQAFTVAIELGIKNGTLGLMVTLTLLHSEAMSVPSAVYGVLMFAFGFLMIGYAKLTGIGKNRDQDPA